MTRSELVLTPEAVEASRGKFREMSGYRVGIPGTDNYGTVTFDNNVMTFDGMLQPEVTDSGAIRFAYVDDDGHDQGEVFLVSPNSYVCFHRYPDDYNWGEG